MDFIKEYKKFQGLKKVYIIFAALLCAVMLYLVLSTNIGQNLSASVSESMNAGPDISIQKNEDLLALQNHKQIPDVNAVQFALWFDPEAVDITSLKSEFGEIHTMIEEPLVHYRLQFDEVMTVNESNLVVMTYDILDTEEEQSIALTGVVYETLEGEYIPTMAGIDGLMY